MYRITRFFLFMFPAEMAHHLSLTCLNIAYQLGILRIKTAARSEVFNLKGLSFPGRVGLAAGLDKNAEYVDALASLGFDFIEVGTVTPKSQQGNPKPRMFRLTKHDAIINRMGFNNKGVDYMIEQLKEIDYKGVLGINIGKNKTTPNENAVSDYLICLEKVYVYASYITINLSSPNTPGLRELQYGHHLNDLLSALKARQNDLSQQHNKYVPLLLKIAPDLTTEEISEISQAVINHDIDGIIATNTSIDKSAVASNEQGGLSGAPILKSSTQVLKSFFEETKGQIPIVGVGGVHDDVSGQEKIASGAALIQIYTGFIYRGPNLIKALKLKLNS
jgi:dihydroorotate dehydrogenase